MPQNTTITVNDGKSTPAAHAFTPTRLNDKFGAQYRDMTMSPVGIADSISYQLTDKAKVRQVAVGMRRPRAVTETVNGVVNTRMADFASATTVLNVPLTWAEADIKDFRVMHANALLNALVADGVDKGAFVY